MTAPWSVRTDTNGAYLWTGSQWQQLVNDVRACPRPSISAAHGVYEIQMAPSNSNIMYMSFNGFVFKSTNKGTTWTQTSLPDFDDSR